jgi:hypothetical protein
MGSWFAGRSSQELGLPWRGFCIASIGQLARIQEAICGTKARKVHQMAVGGVVQEMFKLWGSYVNESQVPVRDAESFR